MTVRFGFKAVEISNVARCRQNPGKGGKGERGDLQTFEAAWE